MFKVFKLMKFKRQVKSWIVENIKSFPVNWLIILDDNKFDTFFKCLVNKVMSQLANENNVVIGDASSVGNILGVVTEYAYYLISNENYGYVFTYLTNIFNDYHKED